MRAVNPCVRVGMILVIATGFSNLGIAASTDRAISRYEAEVSRYPERYPVRVQLADALLQKARESHDLTVLEQARRELHLSLQTQPTYEAYLTMARVQNYSHHFDDAIKWARIAEEASPIEGADSAITAVLVEAYLGLGKTADARELLPISENEPTDYYIAASLAQCLRAEKRYAEAADAFLLAGKIAKKANVAALVDWAEWSAATVRSEADHLH